ncbi:MAG: hypothetical protein KJ709_06225 [Nanoarchaeota archaeon]|nr:hypothetical protein [Nanoarchaeota archaeon]
MVKCKLCNNQFHNSPDSLVVCNHHGGPVHLGCCRDNCSEHNAPCEHAQGIYDRFNNGF